jgi:isopenicillin-N epimerase
LTLSRLQRWFIINDNLRSLFLLDPEVVFLNHGSFGACPQPVFETYQRWQLQLERQPVDFLGRRHDALLDEARAKLGQYLNTHRDNLIFVPNATAGVNTVARSLKLQTGDEILTTNHEYGAVDKTWAYICRQTGAKIVRHEVSLPLTSAEEFVSAFWKAVTPRTRVISISHITSPTALIFPVAEICRRAREAGILTTIDGAHAPGHIPIDLTAIGADFYSGNCHKWLCAPKGAGFLYVHPDHQKLIDPLVISHGWVDDSTFISRNEWQGTRDIAAFLTVPAAIDFQQAYHWDTVRQQCHALASETRQRICNHYGLEPLSVDSTEWFGQMAAIPIPDHDMDTLKRRLYEEYRIEVPVFTWNGFGIVRASFQGYNSRGDADCLVEALTTLVPAG